MYACVCVRVCVCVCVCVRARVRACILACVRVYDSVGGGGGVIEKRCDLLR